MISVNFAHLCDTAIVGQDGRLSVIGIFDRIGVFSLPAVHARMVLAFQLEAKPAEMGNSFDIVVNCMDEDGKKVFEVKGNMKTEVAPGHTLRPTEHPKLNQVIQIGQMALQRAGSYDINILINGELRHTVSFDVVVVPQAPVG